MSNWLKNRPNLAIFLISSLILYLELALIRFLPGNILYLGFFTNLVLLASFLGIGLGFILGRQKFKLYYLFPFALILVTLIAKIFSSGINLVNNEVIFFGNNFTWFKTAYPSWLVLPIIFITVVLTFLTISQLLARFFSESKRPLVSYIYDILGSITGIIFFYLGTYFSLPPPIWFLFIAVIYFLLLDKTKFIIFAVIAFIIAITLTVETSQDKIVWSPYQKVTLQLSAEGGGNILVNNIYHQYFTNIQSRPFYSLIFAQIKQITPLDDVLIIGAGSGQDVNGALSIGAKHIDAVEIHPQILKIGKEYHPNQPYSNPKVNIINTDGRNFLHNTDKKYNVITFSLTDSLVLSAGVAEVRLESYLFTQEAFLEAKKHLKPGGVFVLYNDYRQEWLVERISNMLDQVFGHKPIEIDIGGEGSANRLFISQNSDDESGNPAIVNELPSDNWPFIYLRQHGIPSYYFVIMMIILAFSLVSVSVAMLIAGQTKNFNIPRMTIFFFLGVAFSLIETKSIVQLNLLFGTTWIVNAICFIGILLSVLIACLVSMRFKMNIVFLFPLLIISILIPFFVPLDSLLFRDVAMRLVVALPFFYLPIFFANLIFTQYFKNSHEADFDFGSNILGLVVGGLLEYFALAFGYMSLSIFALVLYLIPFVIILKFRKSI